MSDAFAQTDPGEGQPAQVAAVGVEQAQLADVRHQLREEALVEAVERAGPQRRRPLDERRQRGLEVA